MLAGNTGGGAYAFEPDGRLRWTFQAGNSVWTAPAIARDGTSYWGSVDLNVYALDRQGRKRWSTATLGFVTSSPALSRDGARLHRLLRRQALRARRRHRRDALDVPDHRPRVQLAGADRALQRHAADDRDRLDRRLGVRAVAGRQAALALRHRRRDPFIPGRRPRAPAAAGSSTSAPPTARSMRSTRAPGSAAGRSTRRPATRCSGTATISTARPRWAGAGCTSAASTAGSDYVPYDYCLRRRDVRCTTRPGEAFAAAPQRSTTSPPAATRGRRPARAAVAATAINARLVVRQRGATVDASLVPPTRVTADPPFDFTVQPSGDGHYLHVTPTGFLPARTPAM